MLHNILKRKKKTSLEKNDVSQSHWSDGLYPPSEAMLLEPRIMLDGAAPAVLVDVLSEDQNTGLADTSANDSRDQDIPVLALANDQVKRNELVIVDVTVEGYEQLLADLVGEVDQLFWQTSDAGVESVVAEQDDRLVTVYAINAEQEGLETISTVLSDHKDVDAVHVLSHGTDAGVIFNGTLINSHQLEANADAVSAWGDSLSEQGDILLYGCDTGAHGSDIGFVQTLSSLTGADVAASDDNTGNAAKGGDWELEVSSGSIETALVTEVAAQAGFTGLLSADPVATVDIPGSGFINENFEFCVTADNTGTDAGYEPYVNVFIDPGVQVNSATLMGGSVPVSTFTWDAASGAWLDASNNPLTDHPLDPALSLPPAPGIDGTTWLLVDLPFGSYVPDQPPAKIVFDATLDPSQGAVLGQPINISAQTGFLFGEDPFNNPVADPPALGPLDSSSITPTVIIVEKESFNAGENAVGAESEQATGPNNPITFELKVDLADGQTVDNIILSDLVPNDVHYLGSLTVAGSGTQINIGTSDATIGVHNGNQLSVTFDSVTGTLADDDIYITYQGYIPELDANGVPVLNPASGGAADTVENTVQVDGEFGGVPVSGSDTDEIAPASLAIQKYVEILDGGGSPVARNTILPGDLLEWTLKYQVSDYFTLEEFEIKDTFSDGQLYVTGSETVEIFENGSTTGPSPIAAANVSVGAINPATGLTEVTYDMASVIAAEIPGSLGVLAGDLVDGAPPTGKTWVHVTFQTEVQEEFQFPAVFGGDASVDVGDIIDNDVAITAEVEGTGNVVSDDSSAQVNVELPIATKDIYAVNLDTDGWDTADPEIAPGQSITYRITVTLPTTDVENLNITDYLPLPIFAAAPSYAYTGLYSGVDNVPAPGEYGFGPLTNPADFPASFFNTTGTSLDIVNITVDSTANTVNWDFDPFDQPNSGGGVVDLLFTTATANVPFEDGLSITNQAQVSYDNTNNPQDPIGSIVQIEPLAPVLELTKGVVAVDSGSTGTFAPAAVGPVAFNDAGTAGAAFTGSVTSANLDTTPIDSNVSDLDAGDIVRFAITIENTGGFLATDITVNDSFPSELSIPAGGLNMTAALGDGTPVAVTGNLFNAAGVADPAGIRFMQGANDATIGAGRVDATTVNDGTNIVVLTYDLVVNTTAAPIELLENDAELLTFGALDSGVDYTAGNNSNKWQDTATVETVTPEIQKDLLSSGIVTTDNPLNRAVAGEYITYKVVMTIPEGTTPAARLQDKIDADVRFHELVSVIPSSADLTTNLAGGFAGVVAPASGTAGTFNLGLGDLTNSNTDNTTPETLELVYRVYVRGNAPDFALIRNRAYLHWDTSGNGAPDFVDLWDRAPNLRVITPFLDVQKSITGVPPTDVGDPITYEITVQHAGNSDTTAFNVDFSDTLPVEIGSASLVSVVDGGGAAVPGFTLVGNTISNPDFDLPLNETVTITVTGTVVTAIAGAEIVNTADITWTTLDPTDPKDGVDAVEPTLSDSAEVSFIVNPPTLDKSIVSTGIGTASNDNTQAANGEYVVYRLLVTVPEGTTPTASIIDQLPANVVYDPAYTPTISLSSADLAITNSGVPPTVTAGGLNFDLGTITNTNNSNPTPETITIEYRAYISGAAATDTLTNVADFIWDIDNDGINTGANDGSQIDSSQVEVVEPVLEVVKTVSPNMADAGDTVQYSIVIRHSAASETDAYDATFSDVLPAELVSVALVSAVDGGGTTVPGFSVSGNTVSNADYDLPLGDTITLTVTGVVDTIASAGSTVSNTANIDWDTLGDDTQGNQTAESGGTASNDADFTIHPPSFQKILVSTGIDDASNTNAESVPGEFSTYQLRVTVPEGTTPLVTVTDTLDPDLIFDPSFAITAVASSGVTFTGSGTTPTVSGNDVVFNLGTVTNTDTDNAVDETITITYRAYTDTDAVRGDVLPNDAVLTWDSDNDGDVDGLDGSLTSGSKVRVILPELEITKTLTTTPNDAGDTVVYRYEIAHTAASNAAALDASFSDLLPAEIDANTVTAVDGAGAPVAGFVIVPGATQDTISNPDYDLPEGDSIIVTVTGTVNISASASSTVTNTATIDWDTLGDDVEGNQSAEATGSDDSSVSFVVASPGFAKSINTTSINDTTNDNSEVVAGEYVTYDLVVTVPEGTTPMAQITDTLHFNLLFDTSYAITATGSAGVTFTGPANTPVVSGNDVTFNLGTITNTNVDDTQPDTITITYRVYADSDVARGATLNNDATLIWDADNDGDNNDNDGILNDSVDVTVITPRMLVEKSITQMPSDIGDAIEYTMVIRHTDVTDAPVAPSDTTAYDVTFNDVLPAGLINASIVSAVDSNTNPVAGFTLVGNTVSHTGLDIPLGEFITVKVSAEAGPGITEGSQIDNTANINWSTLDDAANDGFDAGESGGNDNDTATFSLANIEKSIVGTGINDASNDNTEVVTGEYVTYQLLIEVPQGTSPLAEIEDVLDSGLVFDQVNGVSVVPSSNNLTTSTAPGDFSNVTTSYDAVSNSISIELGDITNASAGGVVETLTVTYRVYTDNDAVNAAIGATLNNAVDFKWDIDGDGNNDGPLGP